MKRCLDATQFAVRGPAALRRGGSTALLALLFIVPLHADVMSILYETRPYAAGVSLPTAADYVTNWNALKLNYPAPPAGYGSAYVPEFTDLSNHGTFNGSLEDMAFHTLITLNVTPSQAGIWDMQFGIDYGLGGAMFVDGTLVQFRNTDMWWGGSYGDPNQILAGSVNLAVGGHTVELFGLEHCCDGATEGRYQIGTQPFQTFVAPVPEPGSAILLFTVVGLVGLRSIRRRSMRSDRR